MDVFVVKEQRQSKLSQIVLRWVGIYLKVARKSGEMIIDVSLTFT